MVGGRVLGRRGGWGKKWDKCNNIINKIYYIYTHTYSSKKRNTSSTFNISYFFVCEFIDT